MNVLLGSDFTVLIIDYEALFQIFLFVIFVIVIVYFIRKSRNDN